MENKFIVLGDGVDCVDREAAWYDHIIIDYYYEDKVNGTYEIDSMGTVRINFLVPDGYIARLDVVRFAVDDWGHLTIYPAGDPWNTLLHLGMDKNIDGPPGERGGHEEWWKSGHVELVPGKYVIEASQLNATYNDKGDPRYNVSKCTLDLRARKEEDRIDRS